MMTMTIELSESEMPRPLPLPTFSAPFAAPSLRWACKKRLRCFHPDAAAAATLRPSPDRVRSPSRLPDDVGSLVCSAAVRPPLACPAPSRSPPLPTRSPPPSHPPRNPTEIPVSRREEEEERPDLPSGTRAVAGDEREAVGWYLRSRARGIWREEDKREKQKTKRKVELWVSLSRDEIEGDFFRMTGSKPPRRCRRRGRAASGHLLNGVFPGSCLPNVVTADQYKVFDASDSRKW